MEQFKFQTLHSDCSPRAFQISMHSHLEWTGFWSLSQNSETYRIPSEISFPKLKVFIFGLKVVSVERVPQDFTSLAWLPALLHVINGVSTIRVTSDAPLALLFLRHFAEIRWPNLTRISVTYSDPGVLRALSNSRLPLKSLELGSLFGMDIY